MGKGRTKLGMFDGNLDEGELEIGQIASVIHTIQLVWQVIDEIIKEYYSSLAELSQISGEIS